MYKESVNLCGTAACIRKAYNSGKQGIWQAGPGDWRFTVTMAKQTIPVQSTIDKTIDLLLHTARMTSHAPTDQ